MPRPDSINDRCCVGTLSPRVSRRYLCLKFLALQAAAGDAFVRDRVVGAGSFGATWAARHAHTGAAVALKVFDRRTVKAHGTLRSAIDHRTSRL